MFVLVLGWLAQQSKGWVVLAAGTALAAAGIGIFLAGFTTHQPLISRAGVFITLLAVIFAALAVRARHSRVRGHHAPGQAGSPVQPSEYPQARRHRD